VNPYPGFSPEYCMVDEGRQCSRFILIHEARVTDYLGGKNGGQPMFQASSPSPWRLAFMGGGIYAPQRRMNVAFGYFRTL